MSNASIDNDPVLNGQAWRDFCAELANVARQGHRAVLLYLVQRTDCSHFQIARDIDPAYAIAWGAAHAAGLETLVIGTHITPDAVTLAAPLVLNALPR